MIIGFTRYSRDSSFAVLGRNRLFLIVMAAGSIVGRFMGASLLGIVPNAVLLPILAGILLISSVKVWRAGSGKLRAERSFSKKHNDPIAP